MAAAVLCTALFIAVYLFFVQSASGQLIDVALLETARHYPHPLPELNPANRWIAVWILLPPAVGLCVVTLRARHWVAAGIAAATVVAANLTTQVVKHVWLDRPELIAGAGTSNALPSGHTTMAAAAAVAVFIAAPARQRPVWGLLAVAWSGGWGVFIFVEDWHRPSDMIAAYLVVAGWAVAGGWLIMRLSPGTNTLTHRFSGPAVAAEWFCGICGAAATAGAIALLFLGGGWAGLERTLSGDPSVWHWLSGIAWCLGPALLLGAAALRLFRTEAAEVGPSGVTSSRAGVAALRGPAR